MIPVRWLSKWLSSWFWVIFSIYPIPADLSAQVCSDSLGHSSWGANFTSLLHVVRASESFPWNDESEASNVSDRLAVLGILRVSSSVSIFAKGTSGGYLAGDFRENRFLLDQAHIDFSIAKRAICARLFERERLYRTDHKLLKIVSDEAPFLERRGEGILLNARAGDFLDISYLEAALRDASQVEKVGGLPIFKGSADLMRSIRLETKPVRSFRAGAFLSQTKSTSFEDAAIVCADFEIRLGDQSLIAELARSHRGSLDDLLNVSLFDVDLGDFSFDRPSRVFSPNNAFSVQVEGLSFISPRFGKVTLVPSYSFCGYSFSDIQGELRPASDETSLLAWWHPRTRDAMLAIEGKEGSIGGKKYRALSSDIRMRLKGGFEFAGRVVGSDDISSWGYISLASETNLSRTCIAMRMEDFGSSDKTAFLAQNSINVTKKTSLNFAVYAFDSKTSRYSVGARFRPNDRFFLVFEIGSFRPRSEEMILEYGDSPAAVPEERAIDIFGRFAFGGM